MRIVIDLQPCQGLSRYRGIGRYTMALAKELIRQAVKHEVLLLLNGNFPDSIEAIKSEIGDILPSNSIRVFYATPGKSWIDSAELWKTKVAEMIREYYIISLNPDVVVVSSLFEGFASKEVTSVGDADLSARTVVIHYDLIPSLNPDLYLGSADAVAYNQIKISYLKNAAKLLAISQYSKREAVDYLGIEDDKISVISAAIESKFKPIILSQKEADELKSRYRISGSMVMYAPGGFDPRKNFESLIQAYGKISLDVRRNRQLVIVGKLPSEDTGYQLMRLASNAGLEDGELVITDYIPEDDIVKFYNVAELFVFPSLHEGFGLPPLEAMACGIPVLASNSTSLPEVVGLNDSLFPPTDSDFLALLMTRALLDRDFNRILKTHSLKRAADFSWEGTARLALDSLESLGEGCSRSAGSIASSAKLDTNALILKIARSLDYEALVDDESLIRIASDIDATKSQVFQ